MKAPDIPAAGIPPEQESSKQRSLRIVLWYHRLGGGWLGSKYFWSAVTFAVAAGYVAWLQFGGEAAATHLSPGSVAAAHASLNLDCAKCHKEGVSLTADGEGVNWLSRTFANAEIHPNADHDLNEQAKVLHHTVDAQCRSCHTEQSKPHHDKLVAGDVHGCAACHPEHQGTGASLVRPGNQVCTRCHADIANHHRDKVAKIPNVSEFAFSSKDPVSVQPTPVGNSGGEAVQASTKNDGPHPVFRSLPPTDINNFRFNHQLHLLPGQWARGGNEKDGWTLEKIAEGLRGGYKTVSDTDRRVLLECSSCHVPQRGDPAAQSGAYMLPIRYEQHCKACHPLDLNLPQTPAAPGAAAKSDPLLVPHGLDKRETDEFLAGIAAKQNSGLPPQRYPDTIRIPGKSPSDQQQKEIEKLSLTNTQGSAWRARLEVMCAKCHQTESRPAPKSTDEKFEQAVGFAPPKLPERWLKHGQFDHRAHRSWADCAVCHTNVNPPEPLEKALRVDPEHEYDHLVKPPIDDQKMLIPQINVCVQCHAPAHSATNAKAAARFDCAECHRYHAGAR